MLYSFHSANIGHKKQAHQTNSVFWKQHFQDLQRHFMHHATTHRLRNHHGGQQRDILFIYWQYHSSMWTTPSMHYSPSI